jgi:hypothetical protein
MKDTRHGDRQATLHRQPTLTTADLAAAADRREQQRPDEEVAQLQSGAPVPAEADPQNGERAPLFDSGNAQEFRSRWSIVQQGFVDDPAKAVREGDELVAQVIKSLAETFAQQRETLQGEEGSTEDLRIALRRYRSFFDRLLSV